MAKEFLVRTSERSTFKSCRQRWYWAYVECLVPLRPSKALVLGSYVHEALALRYKPGRKRGPQPAKTFQRMLVAAYESDELPEELFEELMELGMAMLTAYVAEYGTDDRYEIVAPEQPFQIDVRNRKGVYLFTYCGTFDAVIRDLHTGLLGLFEHKTSKDNQPFGAPLALDEQAGAYYAYGPDWARAQGFMAPDEDLDFILYNFLRKAKPDERPKNSEGLHLNKDGSVSKNQPAPLFRREVIHRSPGERASVMRRVATEVREMKMVRSGELKIYKNPDRHCLWCPFRDMCEVHESGSDWQAVRDSQFTKGNPYEAHEVPAA